MTSSFTLESVFAYLLTDKIVSLRLAGVLRDQLQVPFRRYHNELHTLSVLLQVWQWAEATPSRELVIAAAYHDAVYDPMDKANEEKSALYCQKQLYGLFPDQVLAKAADLIRLTREHCPSSNDSDGILLCDADLAILGTDSTEYQAYQIAVRDEYRFVTEVDWANGRRQVLKRFLARDKIYMGEWSGVTLRELQARRNLAHELAQLEVAPKPLDL